MSQQTARAISISGMFDVITQGGQERRVERGLVLCEEQGGGWFVCVDEPDQSDPEGVNSAALGGLVLPSHVGKALYNLVAFPPTIDREAHTT